MGVSSDLSGDRKGAEQQVLTYIGRNDGGGSDGRSEGERDGFRNLTDFYGVQYQHHEIQG